MEYQFVNIVDDTNSPLFDLNFILEVIKRYSPAMVEKVLWINIFEIIKKMRCTENIRR